MNLLKMLTSTSVGGILCVQQLLWSGMMRASQLGHDSDIRYYSRRVIEERARAQQAKQPEARAAHRMLSEIYMERLESLKNGDTLFPVKERT